MVHATLNIAYSKEYVSELKTIDFNFHFISIYSLIFRLKVRG